MGKGFGQRLTRLRSMALTGLSVMLSVAPLALLPDPSIAQDGPGIITTFAGSGPVGEEGGGFSGDGGPAVQAKLYKPWGVATDAKGNVYIADTGNNRIRRVGLDGIIATIAGTGEKGYGGDGGPATQASLFDPGRLVLDAKGFIYFSEPGRVRRIGPDGILVTVAGGGPMGFAGDGGPAIQARFGGVPGLAVDANGVVYIADLQNHRVRRVGLDGIITTIAGTGEKGFGGDGGPATQARLNFPSNVAVDTRGFIYISDTDNSRIRRVGPDGIITTFAGQVLGNRGDGGPATQASLVDCSKSFDIN